MPHIVRPLVVALVATIGDFIWFEYGVRHTTTAGIVHGAALLLAVGIVLGHAAGALANGSLGGIVAGVAGALAFYAVAGTLGYLGGLIAAWAFMWIVLAAINAWLRHGVGRVGEWLARGAVAAVSSGAAFYFVSGIWTDHTPDGGRNYVWHLVAWTIAWAPGLFAVTFVRAKDAQVGG
ncbi:MAG: hypothetical protein FJW21_00460 [Acidimicrobiia bacterium]|nr:hypothetical protein [Acidimicrobiia bacterium]